jgi:hypothetical protein
MTPNKRTRQQHQTNEDTQPQNKAQDCEAAQELDTYESSTEKTKDTTPLQHPEVTATTDTHPRKPTRKKRGPNVQPQSDAMSLTEQYLQRTILLHGKLNRKGHNKGNSRRRRKNPHGEEMPTRAEQRTQTATGSATQEDTQNLLPQCSQTHHNPDKYLTTMSDNQNASAIMKLQSPPTQRSHWPRIRTSHDAPPI